MQQIQLQIVDTYKSITNYVRRHAILFGLIVSTIIIASYGYKVNSLTNVTRDEQTYQTAVSQANTPRFNQTTIDRVKDLSDSGAKNPGTDVNPDRTNPFAQ